MKRKSSVQEIDEPQEPHQSPQVPKIKKPRVKKAKAEVKVVEAKVGDYCYAATKSDENGLPIWPVPSGQMIAAQEFLQECATAQQTTLIVPDKDADGLSAGVIIYRTLMKLGLDPKHLHVHLIQKGSNIHEESERRLMLAKSPKFVIVLDQGSRGGPPVIDSDDTKCMVIDHHLSDEFPRDATVISACHFPPVATTSLLAYEICKQLHPSIPWECGYLCVIGTHGDLGTNLKWLKPFPDMKETFKKNTRSDINDCVSLINAPRRTAAYNVITSWNVLLNDSSPKSITSNKNLLESRYECKIETEKKAHARPEFSKDGKFAVLKIDSGFQVHPVIATRWAGFLKSKVLEIVMVANYGYLPGKVNFSCRIAKCARGRDTPVNIIESLKAVAHLDEGDLVTRLGESFARGHKEASGGIVGTEEFEEFYRLMKVGEKPDTTTTGQISKKKTMHKSPQKNTLGNYFAKI